MVVSDETVKMEESSGLRFYKKIGGSLIRHPGVFSEDSKYLFITWGNSVRSYNVETGDFVTSYEGLLEDAIGVSLHPSILGRIIAISCAGELMEWQYNEGVNRRFNSGRYIKLDSHLNVKSFSLVHLEDDDAPCAVCAVMVEGHSDALIKIFCVVTGREKQVFPPIWAENNNHSFSLRKTSDDILISSFESSFRVTFCIKSGSNWKINYAQSQHRLTCVASHPSELSVVTGDIIGCIRLWRNLLQNPVFSLYHWHTLPVETLAFSMTGTYFYSGGGECVLVKWLLDSPQDKGFLPRLPAEIAWLSRSPDNSWVAVSTRDNAIQLVDSANTVQRTIQHFSKTVLPSYRESDDTLSLGMLYDPRTKSLVMNARTGHIQFFSTDQESLSFLLDVVGQNYITQERHKIIKNTEVVKFAFSCDGYWLATVEFCESEKHTYVELRLKFWRFDKVKQIYILNSSIENPHRGKIFSVTFCPANQDLMCITTGEDLKFRTWVIEEIQFGQDESQLKYQWKILNIGYYRNLPAREVSFSVDGSLVAVTFGPTLTVWVPGINQIKCSLTPPETTEDLTHLVFGQKSLHLIVTGSRKGLAVWNLLSLSLLWSVPFNLNILVPDPESDILAAFSTTNDVVIFTPNSHEPIFQKDSLMELKDCKIMNAAFIPHTSYRIKGMTWQSNSQLYFITSKQELFYVQDPNQEAYELERQNLDVMPDSFQPQTAFGLFMAKETRSDVVKIENKHHHQLGMPGQKSLKEFLASPPHAMPPLSVYCYSLLLSFLVKKEEESKNSQFLKMSTKETKMDYGDQSEDETPKEPISSKPTFEERKQNFMKTQQSSEVSPSVPKEQNLEKIRRHKFNWVSNFISE